MLGEMSKSLNGHNHVEGEGIDELFWFALGVGRMGIGDMPG